jgi:hypothetical protein
LAFFEIDNFVRGHNTLLVSDSSGRLFVHIFIIRFFLFFRYSNIRKATFDFQYCGAFFYSRVV